MKGDLSSQDSSSPVSFGTTGHLESESGSVVQFRENPEDWDGVQGPG